MHTWDRAIHEMLVTVAANQPSERVADIEHSTRLIVWAALRANIAHPEWAQAKMLSVPDLALVDKLAAILVHGTPVERMAV